MLNGGPMNIAISLLSVFAVLGLVAWGLCVAAEKGIPDEDEDCE
jgi:hypothetical protein